MNRMIVFLLVIVLLGSNAYAFNEVYWDGTGGWMNANWTEVLGDGGEWSVPGWVVGNTSSGNGTPNDGSYNWNKGYAMIQNGTIQVTAASMPDGRVERIYLGDAQLDVQANLLAYRTYNNAGTMNVSADFSTTYWYIAPGSSDSVTINQTAGTVVLSDKAYFGADSGVDNAIMNYNLSGGVFDATVNIAYLGRYGGANTTFTFNQTGGAYNSIITRMGNSANGEQTYYNISDGDFDVTKYVRLYNNATFEVIGSDASSVRMRQLVIDAGNTLSVALDENGSTLIEVYGDGVEAGYENYYGVTLDNAILSLDTLAGFDSVVGNTYDILWSATTISADGLSVLNSSGTVFDYNIIAGANGGELLRVTVVPEPTSMLLLSIGGLVLKRKLRQNR